jgi:hypothetical protein
MATKKKARSKGTCRQPADPLEAAAHAAYDRALATGAAADIDAALALEALAFARADADAEALVRFGKLARDYFAARGHAPSLPLLKQDGAEEICVRMYELFEDLALGDPPPIAGGVREPAWPDLAAEIIALAAELRPGLVKLAAYYQAESPRVREELARELVSELAAELRRFTKNRKWDTDDWAEGATRLTLRVLGDEQAANALKHRAKAPRQR